ncbi:MAG: hypothetical protein IPK83_08765 [Planctomycetes bacterium]|nr:hypothetical protein [Planctomycetota bacterium]
MNFLCTLIDWFFGLAQFLANNIYGFFGATIPDVSATFDAIFGCVA